MRQDDCTSIIMNHGDDFVHLREYFVIEALKNPCQAVYVHIFGCDLLGKLIQCSVSKSGSYNFIDVYTIDQKVPVSGIELHAFNY
jgi:hypothetical protein